MVVSDDTKCKPGTNGQAIDRRTVARWLRVFIEPKQVAELRCPDAGRYRTVSGYFDDLDMMAETALGWSRKVAAVYFTINPCQPDLLARRVNRAEAYAKETTSDSGILTRRWFFVDFDPKRASGISSTAAEHAAALERAEQCRDWLSADGWPSPVEADSGNGAHLHYAIDLPNDEESRRLLEQCLKALAFRFSDARVEVDLKTFNAARICKVYGTVTCKGDSTPERPHRVARVLAVPDPLVKVPRDLLEGLAASTPDEPAEMERKGHVFTMKASGFDLERWIKEHNLPVVCSGDWKDGKKWVLNPCPWNEEHTNRAAFIVQMGNGKIGAGCHHNGCAGKGWHDLRDVYEPGWRERRAAWEQAAQQTQANDTESTAGAVGLALTCLSGISPEPVRWLVPEYLPLGKLLLIAGDGGHGKSTLTLHLTACLTQGFPCFGLDYDPLPQAEVLLVSCEDDFGDTVVPRLLASGADLKRVFRVDGIKAKDGKPLPFNMSHYTALEQELQARPGSRLVVIDPAGAYVGATKTDDHKDSELRALLSPLAELAARCRVTILLVKVSVHGSNRPVFRGIFDDIPMSITQLSPSDTMSVLENAGFRPVNAYLVKHLVKGATAKAVNKVSGSAGYVNSVRAAFVVAPDALDEVKKLFLPLKFNLGPKPSGLQYALEPLPEEDQQRIVGQFPHLDAEDQGRLAKQLFRTVWKGKVDVTADRALGEAAKQERGPNKVDSCMDWLRTFLAEYAYPSDEILKAAKAEGYTFDNVKDAKARLKADGLRSSSKGRYQGVWWTGFGFPDQWKPRPKTPHLPHIGKTEAPQDFTSTIPLPTLANVGRQDERHNSLPANELSQSGVSGESFCGGVDGEPDGKIWTPFDY